MRWLQKCIWGDIMLKVKTKMKKVVLKVFLLISMMLIPANVVMAAPMTNLWNYNNWVGWNFTKTGNYVYIVQQMLYTSNLGSTVGNIDGIYGANTQNAIMQYQQRFGLTADGTVGTQTWNEFKAFVYHISNMDSYSYTTYEYLDPSYRDAYYKTFFKEANNSGLWYCIRDNTYQTVE